MNYTVNQYVFHEILVKIQYYVIEIQWCLQQILQYGVSYSKSYSLMAQGMLLAAEYKGETVECCIVDKSKLG